MAEVLTDIEKERASGESDEEWFVRRVFLRAHWFNPLIARSYLVYLSDCLTGVCFHGQSYPDSVVQELQELTEPRQTRDPGQDNVPEHHVAGQGSFEERCESSAQRPSKVPRLGSSTAVTSTGDRDYRDDYNPSTHSRALGDEQWQYLREARIASKCNKNKSNIVCSDDVGVPNSHDTDLRSLTCAYDPSSSCDVDTRLSSSCSKEVPAWQLSLGNKTTGHTGCSFLEDTLYDDDDCIITDVTKLARNSIPRFSSALVNDSEGCHRVGHVLVASDVKSNDGIVRRNGSLSDSRLDALSVSRVRENSDTQRSTCAATTACEDEYERSSDHSNIPKPSNTQSAAALHNGFGGMSGPHRNRQTVEGVECTTTNLSQCQTLFKRMEVLCRKYADEMPDHVDVLHEAAAQLQAQITTDRGMNGKSVAFNFRMFVNGVEVASLVGTNKSDVAERVSCGVVVKRLLSGNWKLVPSKTGLKLVDVPKSILKNRDITVQPKVNLLVQSDLSTSVNNLNEPDDTNKTKKKKKPSKHKVEIATHNMKRLMEFLSTISSAKSHFASPAQLEKKMCRTVLDVEAMFQKWAEKSRELILNDRNQSKKLVGMMKWVNSAAFSMRLNVVVVVTKAVKFTCRIMVDLIEVSASTSKVKNDCIRMSVYGLVSKLKLPVWRIVQHDCGVGLSLLTAHDTSSCMEKFPIDRSKLIGEYLAPVDRCVDAALLPVVKVVTVLSGYQAGQLFSSNQADPGVKSPKITTEFVSSEPMTLDDLLKNFVVKVSAADPSPVASLSASAVASQVKLRQIKFKVDGDPLFRIKYELGGFVISDAAATYNQEARLAAAQQAMKVLQSLCPTVFEKDVLYDHCPLDMVVDQATLERLSQKYSQQGSSMAVSPPGTVNRAWKVFLPKVHSLIQNFKQNCFDDDLVFGPSFSAQQRSAVISQAEMMDLTCEVKQGTAGEEYLVVGKKRSLCELVDFLRARGKESFQYSLVEPMSLAV